MKNKHLWAHNTMLALDTSDIPFNKQVQLKQASQVRWWDNKITVYSQCQVL